MVRHKKKSAKKPSTPLARVWYFLWYDDSIWSWIANIIIAFVLIKFLVYPGLALAFGTELPVVAVVSCSMEHQFTNCGNNPAPERLCNMTGEGFVTPSNYWNACGDFYEKRNISFEKFQTYPFKNGFNKGDIILLKGEESKDIEVGEVIIFEGNKVAYPVIHRVVKIHEENGSYRFETKGDHNSRQIETTVLNETDITPDEIIGVGVGRVPFVGYLKIGFVKLISLFGL
ncbi:MAG: signal peptidase I [Nanobdellota archaeon]